MHQNFETIPPEARGCAERLRALWSRRALRAQLLLALLAIQSAAALIGVSVIILRARDATSVEMASSMRLADRLAAETIRAIAPDAQPDRALQSLLRQLRHTRHVLVEVTDASGAPVSDPADPAQDDARPAAPPWFSALIAPREERVELPVIIRERRIGSVRIIGQPRDEIAEAWGNAQALAGLALLFNGLVAGVLYVMFGRIFGPLTDVSAGLSDLERQRFKARIAPPAVRELAEIVVRFNALAEALEAAHRANADLNRRLIEVEDEERRQIALELHDEFGPCLFGLRSNARALTGACAKISDSRQADEIGELAAAIVAIAERMQMTNRHLLNSLRPMALGHAPLSEVLDGLVEGFARLYPAVSFSLNTAGIEPTYGDRLDLTMYRCIQESLTNAVRHADAARIDVAVREEPPAGAAGGRIVLDVCDSGKGLAPGVSLGLGLTGMRERVQALGGDWSLIDRGSAGAAISVTFPSSVAHMGGSFTEHSLTETGAVAT